jgi:rhodanese-related sulfurtransferase
MPAQTNTLVRRIGINEANRRMKDVVFVDVRRATSLKRNPEQVPGAIHVPIKELNQRAKRLPCDRTLVTYCT